MQKSHENAVGKMAVGGWKACVFCTWLGPDGWARAAAGLINKTKNCKSMLKCNWRKPHFCQKVCFGFRHIWRFCQEAGWDVKVLLETFWIRFYGLSNRLRPPQPAAVFVSWLRVVEAVIKSFIVHRIERALIQVSNHLSTLLGEASRRQHVSGPRGYQRRCRN